MLRRYMGMCGVILIPLGILAMGYYFFILVALALFSGRLIKYRTPRHEAHLAQKNKT